MGECFLTQTSKPVYIMKHRPRLLVQYCAKTSCKNLAARHRGMIPVLIQHCVKTVIRFANQKCCSYLLKPQTTVAIRILRLLDVCCMWSLISLDSNNKPIRAEFFTEDPQMKWKPRMSQLHGCLISALKATKIHTHSTLCTLHASFEIFSQKKF